MFNYVDLASVAYNNLKLITRSDLRAWDKNRSSTGIITRRNNVTLEAQFFAKSERSVEEDKL